MTYVSFSKMAAARFGQYNQIYCPRTRRLLRKEKHDTRALLIQGSETEGVRLMQRLGQGAGKQSLCKSGFGR